MTRVIRRTAALVWLMLPPFLLSALGHVQTFAGCTAVVGVIVFMAIFPAIALGWTEGLSGSRAATHA
jgi:hypothetical protein